MRVDHQWITTPISQSLLRGAIELEATSHGLLPHRLPGRARVQCADPLLAMVESQPSGVRLVFRTRATAIELDVLPTRRIYAGFPPRPDGVYDLCVDGRLVRQSSVAGGNVMHVDMATGEIRREAGAPGTLSFDGLAPGDKLVEIWLPHNEMAELVALRTDASVAPAEKTGLKTWLHHGSSISHGSDAASPTGTWPAIAAALAGVSLINLGLGGNALLDPFTARTIRDTPADLISVKFGINLVNTDAMRMRAFGPAMHGFLDTIREGHPTVPLLVASPVLCPIHEDTPGPTAPDLVDGRLLYRAAGDPRDVAGGKLTLSVIRDVLAWIVAERAVTDPNIHYLDGRALYGEADHAALPLPDRLHPDAATHRLIGERFARLAFARSAPLDPAQGKANPAPNRGASRRSGP